jgi:hypothetical protein
MIRSQVHLSLVRHLGGPPIARRPRTTPPTLEELDASELEEVAE